MVAPILPNGPDGSAEYIRLINFRYACRIYNEAYLVMDWWLFEELEEMVTDLLEEPMDVVAFVMEFEELLFDTYPMVYDWISNRIL